MSDIKICKQRTVLHTVIDQNGQPSNLVLYVWPSSLPLHLELEIIRECGNLPRCEWKATLPEAAVDTMHHALGTVLPYIDADFLD